MSEPAVNPLAKSAIRKQLRETLQAMSEPDRHAKSLAACTFISTSPEFAAARVVMLYLSTPTEVDTAPLALRAWQAGKTVVVPKEIGRASCRERGCRAGGAV